MSLYLDHDLFKNGPRTALALIVLEVIAIFIFPKISKFGLLLYMPLLLRNPKSSQKESRGCMDQFGVALAK